MYRFTVASALLFKAVAQDLPPLTVLGAEGLLNEADFPLLKCQGDCNRNRECAGNLVCFNRGGATTIPGCSGRAPLDGTDFCWDPTDKPLEGVIAHVGSNGSPTVLFPLQRCAGECSDDSDCQSDLVCLKRQLPTDPVWGCEGPLVDRRDYCVDPSDVPGSAPGDTTPDTSPTTNPVDDVTVADPVDDGTDTDTSDTDTPTKAPVVVPTPVFVQTEAPIITPVVAPIIISSTEAPTNPRTSNPPVLQPVSQSTPNLSMDDRASSINEADSSSAEGGMGNNIGLLALIGIAMLCVTVIIGLYIRNRKSNGQNDAGVASTEPTGPFDLNSQPNSTNNNISGQSAIGELMGDGGGRMSTVIDSQTTPPFAQVVNEDSSEKVLSGFLDYKHQVRSVDPSEERITPTPSASTPAVAVAVHDVDQVEA